MRYPVIVCNFRRAPWTSYTTNTYSTTKTYYSDSDQNSRVVIVFSNAGNRLLTINNTSRQEKTSINVLALPGGAYFVEVKRKSGKTRYFQFLKIQ